MTSTCKIIVDRLNSLDSKLKTFRAFKPLGSDRDIYYRLNEQIRHILRNFRFLLPLCDCLSKCIVTEDKNLQSLAIEIQTTIEEAAKKVKPADVDNVWQDICKMTEERELQAVKETTFLWLKRWITTPTKVSKLFDVLREVNEKIHLLKPKIEKLCCATLSRSMQISQTPLCEISSGKEFGLEWLVSTTRSFLSIIVPETIGHANCLGVLEFRRRLSNLRILLHGIPDNLRIADITGEGARVAIVALLLACLWWVRVGEYRGFTGIFDDLSTNALFDQQCMISASNPETLTKIFRLLGYLKKIDPPLFSEKVIQFAQYILPHHLIGPVKFTRETRTYKITISSKIEMKPGDFLPYLTQLILEIKESFDCWLPEEDGLLMINLLANVCLMWIEAIFIQQLRDIDTFRYCFEISKEWKFQYSKEWPEETGENIKQILIFLNKAASFEDIRGCRFLCQKTIVYFSVLLKVQLFKLKRELESYNRNSKFSLEEKVQSFEDRSKFLFNSFARCEDDTEEYKKACSKYEARIESMLKMVVSSCNSFQNHYNISEEMVLSVERIFSGLLDDVENFLTKIAEELCIPVRMSNIPKTNALGFYDILLGKIDELMNSKDSLFISFKEYIEELLAHLHFFRNFLGNYLVPEWETQEFRDFCVHVAYEAEYLIDSIVFSDISQWKFLIWLYILLLNMRHIKRQISKINEKKKAYAVQIHNIPQSLRQRVSRASTPRVDDTVQSLNDEQNSIIDLLVGGYRQQGIVSIVGMPGIGKTTLAKQVYNSWTVVHHFHIRAWCCVGEVYQKRELLFQILSHLIVLTENILGKSVEDLEFKLRQLLMKQKYLIVFDDMWTTEAWNDLQTSLPENENGSRILITSRSYHSGLKAEAHYLRLLSDDESWALLQMKIFEEECCPNELIEVGQEIAKNCKGLPLAIVAMAGILKRIDKQEHLWKELANDLSSQVVDDPHEQCRDILELSYMFLPENLKACFLYLGAFPEDQEIPVTKLIRLWIAEGFVEKTELKSLEEVAEDYLKDLIGRSLIIFAHPKSRGGPKACRVHDMLRYFCQLKAKEDNFLRLITMSNDSSSLLDDLYFLVNDKFSNPSSQQTYEDYRLCFYAKRNQFIQSRPSGMLVHSLLFFPINDKYARSSYDISFIFNNFSRLKVLDLEHINIGPSFPSGIKFMLLLKYFAVSGDIESVRSSVFQLSNLETFVLKGLKGRVNLPDTIWDLKRLRHVQVTDVAIMSLNGTSFPSHGSGNSCLLDSLVTLSTVFLPYGDDTNSILKMFPNLQKLGCIFSESPIQYRRYKRFPKLDVLTKLESLKISYCGKALSTAKFIFPLSLKKLTLSNFCLPWSHISMIGRLKNLEVLKLLSKAYDGDTWDMAEGEFHNLKFLKLENLSVSKWNACSDNLPNLEKLVLINCKHLEEVPSSFVEICTLKMIEVKWCGKSAEDSVRRMRDEADEFLNIVITSDFELSL